MGFGSLIAKLMMDSSDFQRGINDAQKKAFSFGDNLEKTVGNKLKAAFGAGAIISAMRSVINHVEEMTEKAKELGITVEELQKQNGETFGRISNETANFVDESTRGFGKVANILKNLFAETLRVNPFAMAANLISRKLDPEGAAERQAAAVPGAPGPLASFTGRAGGMTGPDNPFTNPMNAFELSRKTFSGHANSLQQIGAESGVKQQTVELKTLVQVVRDSNFVLKKIEAKTGSENLVLAP